jgi:hypothetical protein
LKEFKDVFPDELPHGLPSLQGIEHHIDFMQGATLPKGTTHHTKTDEQEDMQRPTHDCQAHGYVHEILSPRVVPTNLVMPLGCSFVSSFVLCLMQQILNHLVGKGVITSLDDNLMCSKNLKDHIIYVREALCTFRS